MLHPRFTALGISFSRGLRGSTVNFVHIREETFTVAECNYGIVLEVPFSIPSDTGLVFPPISLE